MSDESVRDWLTAAGLGQYADVFEANRIGVDVLPLLSDQDLKDLGVPLGDRRRLLAAAASRGPASPSSPAPATAPPPATNAHAERRQLTALFCDMVGYTELASRLDPEVLQAIVRAYEDISAASIARYEGYVFQRLGDGIVAFFGYPLAHEGEAERAVRAGLAIVAALAAREVAPVGHLAVRIGIATGLVVVSSVEKGAVGEAMNLAARLQAIAQPGSVVVSEHVHRLAGGAFEYQDLGEHRLKGIAQPTHAYRIVGVSDAASRFEAATYAGLTPLVGREQELGLLLERWQLAQDGEGQVALLSGEPGIGKSRILSALRERLEGQGAQSLRFQCSPYYVNSALWPSIDNFERGLKFARDENAESKLDKLEALIVTHYGRPIADVRFAAALLSIPSESRYGPVSMTPQRFKDETLRTLVDLSEAAARKQPSVMLFEDAHWTDPTSLEVLDLLIDRVKSIPLLIVLTHRPEFQSRWSSHGHVTALNLSKLSRAQSSAMIGKVTGGKALPGELHEQILTKTDGVPLYVEELTKSILESGALTETEARYEYAGATHNISIPATLRDSLMARLDRFAPVKAITQIGAAIGREFSYELIEAIAPMNQTQLDRALAQLTESGLAFRRGTPPEATYTFKHALVQDAAYDSLLKSRRQELHAEIARTIEERLPELKDSEPEVLARHLTQAGLNKRAVPYWMRAGQRALERVALAEAVGHLMVALEVNDQLPTSAERDEKELDIRVLLATAYLAQRGWVAVEMAQTLEPARALAYRLGRHDQLASILWYIGNHHGVRAEYARKLEIDQQLDALAKSQEDSIAYVVARWAELQTQCWMGNFVAARVAGDQMLSAYDRARHGRLIQIFNHDLECDTLLWAGIWLWALGYPDQAKETVLRQLQLARRLGHAFQLAWALIGGAWPLLWRGETSLVLELLAEGHAIALENSLGYLASVAVGWTEGLALIERGDCAEGYVKLTRAARAWHDAGGRFLIPWWDAQRASALLMLGRDAEAKALLDAALAISDETGHRFWEAESHRGLGELLQRPKPVADLAAAEASFRKSLEVARAQHAKGFELRAAMSLARLWRAQGRRRDAYDLLVPVYDWFTEGFDTKDLMEAKALVEELR